MLKWIKNEVKNKSFERFFALFEIAQNGTKIFVNPVFYHFTFYKDLPNEWSSLHHRNARQRLKRWR